MEEKGMEPPDSPPPPYPGYPTNYPARPAGSQPYYPAPSGGLYTNQPGGYLADQSDRSRPILQQGYPPYQQQYGPPHAAAHMTSVGHVIIAQPQQVTGVLSDVQPPMPQTYLALALVTCLCFSPLFGVIALCFAAASQSAYENGDVVAAKRHGTTALLLCILGIVLSLVILVIILTAGVKY